MDENTAATASLTDPEQAGIPSPTALDDILKSGKHREIREFQSSI